MEIRNAYKSDLPLVNEIMRLSKATWGYDEAFMIHFMEKMSLKEDYLIKNHLKLFCRDDQIIGFFAFIIHKDNSLELDQFFLHPDYIGKGIGKKLWMASCNFAKKLGAKEFTLWADPNAESFYAKMGCEKIGVKKSPFMPDRYPPVMRYKLT